MTTTDREIRLSEIPAELRNLREEAERWRAKWAQDTTELRKQVRELTERVRETATARDAARRTCDDLTDHCESQGKRIAHLDAENAALSAEIDTLARDKAASYQRGIAVGRRMGEERFHSAIADLREMLVEVLQSEVVGMDCGTCDGTGKIRDEVDDYSHTSGHFTRPGEVYDCEDCFGGRVAR